MADDTMREIGALLRAAREPGTASDPAYFERKAALLEQIAAQDPHLADEALACAAEARDRARRLGGETP
jgi:hypothetical protein